MKKSALLLSLAIVAIALSSCHKVIGDGPVVTELRAVSNFTGVSASFSGKVNFTIEPVFRVEVKAQENILDVLETKVRNGVLEIKFKDGTNVGTFREITANISAPTADYLRVSGSGNMDVTGNLVTNNLEMNVIGSGNLVIQNATITNQLEAAISGSGSMIMSAGTAKNEDLTISGSGNMDFSKVTAEKAITHTTGSGSIKVKLSQTLDAHISGSGSVYYDGNPAINSHITGSGKVRQL